MNYRRNINCLSDDQLHDLREVLAILFSLPDSSEHSWMSIAGIHGYPGEYCRHGAPGFFTWHRAYLLKLEEAIHCLNPDVMIPYWNWSSGPTTGVPAACATSTYVNRDGATVANPLYAGPLHEDKGGGMTTRSSSIDTTTFDDLAESAQTAMENDDFDDFQSAVSSVHGSVHTRTGGFGGSMSDVETAAYDPIFYLHHANVDRLWALWQTSHADPLSVDEATFELDPFLDPGGTDLYVGSDMESTTDLGYRYAYFCLRLLGPFVLTPIPLRFPWIWDGFEKAKLVFRSTKMPSLSSEIRVFVGDPGANEKTATTGNPNFAGRLGLFGMSSESMSHGKKGSRSHHGDTGPSARAMGERFDLQLDVTTALRATASANKKEATVTLVPVDLKGRRVMVDDLPFDGVEIHHMTDKCEC